MKKYLPLLLLILFSFCSQKNENRLPRIIVSNKDNVIEVNCKEMISMQGFRFFAANIGDDFGYKVKESDRGQDEFCRKIDLNAAIPKYDIKVIVDTSYTFPASGFQYKVITLPKEIVVDGLINGKEPTQEQLKFSEKEYFKHSNEKFKQRNDFVKCYPLLILNKSKDSALTRFRFIQEAKDANGKWKPIECYYNFGGCGNPEMYFYNVIPNKYMIYPIIKYHGDFKTKLRIKLYNKGNVYYSNEFSGYINSSQFDTTTLRNSFKLYNPDYSFDEVSGIFFLEE